MQRTVQLHVPEPCHENWNKMTATEKGRFCLSCKKEVIDFTFMNDQQILQHISKLNEGFCGRFCNSQLNRDIKQAKKQQLSWYKYFVHVIIPALLISNKLSAQENRVIGDTSFFVPVRSQFQNLTGKVNIPKDARVDQKSSIAGIVLDENQIPIPFATVMIKGTKEGVSCDAEGKFRMLLNKNMSTVQVKVFCIGYEAGEFLVKNNSEENKLKLKIRSTQGLGEVVVTGVVYSKKWKHSLQQIKDTIVTLCKKETVNVYPNPAHFGSTLNIDLDMKETGEYNIIISSISGQPLIQKKINLISKKQTEQIGLTGNLQGGIYFVTIENTNSKKIYTNKTLIN